MIAVVIPDYGPLQLQHLVLDYNGTLALDGRLLPRVAGGLRRLAKTMQIHVVTADSFGVAATQLAGLPLTLKILPPAAQADGKRDFVTQLGRKTVVAIGNGRNDRKMLKAAALGIAVIQREGAAAETVAAADVVSSSILEALDLLQNPKRLLATLRS